MAGLFRTYRADGGVQLDSDNMTLAFSGKGTVSTQAAWQTPQGASTAYVPIDPSSDQLTAVLADGGYGLARYTTRQINGQAVEVYQSNAPTGTNVTYWTFDRMSTRSVAGFGLELFDAAGNLTFSSNQRPLVTAFPGFSGNFGGNPGRTYALVIPYGAYQGTHYDPQIESEDVESTDSKGKTTTTTNYFYNFTTTNVLRGMGASGYLAGPQDIAYNSGTGRASVPNSSSPPPPDNVVYDIPLRYQLIVDVTGL